MMAGLMEGKRGLIMGLANDKSLAWGIAKALSAQGAELAFSYQGAMMEKRVLPLAEELGVPHLIECDVSDAANLERAFAELAETWPTIDFLVHAIGFSDKNELRGLYVDTSLDNFLMTMNISAYSMVAVTRHARKMMPNGGSVLTLTYYGAEKVVPHYNVMGVAKAALDRTFEALAARWPTIDFVVHAIGYTNKETLRGRYAEIGLDDFLLTMNISVYSFTAVAQRAAKLMPNGGALLTLSYYGAEKVVPHYNVMGIAKAALETSVKYLANDFGPDNIRVNAISAGPIKTLAASGIGDFRYILKWNEYNAPLRRNVTIDEVGGSGLYLLSDLSAGVTGEVHHVDAGYHVVGMLATDAAQPVSEMLANFKTVDG